MKVKFQDWTCHVKCGVYARGGTALELVDEFTGEPVATATVWIPGLEPGEVAVKDYSENEGMLEALVLENIVAEPHRYEHSGFVEIPVCKLNTAKFV